MIALLRHRSNILPYLSRVLVILIGFEATDVAGELGLDDGYRHLTPIGDMNSWDLSPGARIFEATTEMTGRPDFLILLPETWGQQCLRRRLV